MKTKLSIKRTAAEAASVISLYAVCMTAAEVFTFRQHGTLFLYLCGMIVFSLIFGFSIHIMQKNSASDVLTAGKRSFFRIARVLAIVMTAIQLPLLFEWIKHCREPGLWDFFTASDFIFTAVFWLFILYMTDRRLNVPKEEADI